MYFPRSVWTALITLSTLFIVPIVIAAPAPGPVSDSTSVKNAEQNPSPLPDDVAKAWQDAGAEVGWMGFGWSQFFQRAEGKPGEIAAFRIRQWEPGVIKKLPPPAQGFGLDLAYTALTDDGLKEFSGLKNLQRLNIENSKVTDAGLKELAALTDLQMLGFRKTQLTDAGLKQIAGLKNLRSLNLLGTRVTDAGMQIVAKFSALQTLDVTSTFVTDAGIQELQQKLPMCKISH